MGRGSGRAPGSNAGAAAPLLERDRELRTLTAAVDACGARRGGLVLLRGNAGSGKSSLVDGACSAAADRGALVLRVRCAEFERDFPFGSVHELLQPVVAAAARGERARLFAGSAALAEPLFAARALHRGDREDRAASLIEGIGWLLANLATDRQAGIVLAVDDAHACDRASLRALARIALRGDELGVLLLLALRPGAVAPEADVIPWLAADPRAVVLDLSPLSRDGVAQLVERVLRRPPEAAFAEACTQVTGGNPYLTHELLVALRADGVEPDRAGVDAVRRMVPDAVLRSVSARVARLGGNARAVAHAVAILGPRAPSVRVAELAGLDAEATAAAVDALVGAGLLAAEAPLRFRHPLVGTAVERELTPLARARAHGRAAAILRQHGAPDERVAAHLLAGRVGEHSWAVGVLRAAAARSMRSGSPQSAVALLRRALEEPPPRERRLAVVRELAQAEAAAGEPEATRRLLDVLDAAAEPAERIRALRELSRLQFLNEHHHEAATTIRRAMAESGEEHPALLVEYVAAAGIGSSTLDPSMRRDVEALFGRWLSQLEAGTLPDEPAVLIQVANVVGAGRGRRRTVRELVVRAMRHGPLDHLPPYGIGTSWAVLALACVDELPLADRVAESSHRAAEAAGSMYAIGKAAFSRALVAVERGDLADAVIAADTALDLARSAVPTTMVWSAVLLVLARIARGDLDGAQRAIAVAERSDAGAVDGGIALHGRAALQLALAAPEPALDVAVAAGDALDRYGLRDYPLFPWRLTAARAAHRLGRASDGVRLAEQELALARGSDAPSSVGRALVACAEVGDDGDRERELLEEAAEILAGSHARLERAVALCRLGAARRRAGRSTDAREALLTALDLAHLCDAHPLIAEARAQLRLLGIRPRRPARTGPAALTPAERRVAELASGKRTNREIAHELHLTVSTVEFHLTRAYRKLGVRSRRELAASLRRSTAR